MEELAQRHGLSTDILSRVGDSTTAGNSGFSRQQFSLESLTKLPTAQDPKTYVNTTIVDVFRSGESALEVRERLGEELGPPAPADDTRTSATSWSELRTSNRETFDPTATVENQGVYYSSVSSSTLQQRSFDDRELPAAPAPGDAPPSGDAQTQHLVSSTDVVGTVNYSEGYSKPRLYWLDDPYIRSAYFPARVTNRSWSDGTTTYDYVEEGTLADDGDRQGAYESSKRQTSGSGLSGTTELLGPPPTPQVYPTGTNPIGTRTSGGVSVSGYEESGVYPYFGETPASGDAGGSGGTSGNQNGGSGNQQPPPTNPASPGHYRRTYSDPNLRPISADFTPDGRESDVAPPGVSSPSGPLVFVPEDFPIHSNRDTSRILIPLSPTAQESLEEIRAREAYLDATAR